MGYGKINYKKTDKRDKKTGKLEKADRFEYNYVYFMKQMIDFMLKVRDFRNMMFSIYPQIVGHDCFLKEVLNMYYLDFIRNNNTTKNQFPISIETHINKYINVSQKEYNNFRNIDHKNIVKQKINKIKAENLSGMIYRYKIIPWNDVKFQTKEHGELHYATCAETTVLNTLMYLLYDKDKNEITLENIRQYNREYPINKVKAFFNDELVKQESIPLALEIKLSEFCLNLNELANIKYLNFDKYEVSGNIYNFIAVMLVICGINITDSNIDANNELFIKLFNDFGKNIKLENIIYKKVKKEGSEEETEEGSIIIDDVIKLSNSGTHIEMNLIKELYFTDILKCNFLHFNTEKLVGDNIVFDYDLENYITVTKKYFDIQTLNNDGHKIDMLLYYHMSNIPHLKNSILEGKTILYLSVGGNIDFNEFTTFFKSEEHKDIKYNLIIYLNPENKIGDTIVTINDIDIPNVLYLALQLINPPDSPDIEFNIDIGPNQLNNVKKLQLSKNFNGNISPDSLINCESLSFIDGYDSKYNTPIGENQFPKLTELILNNFDSNIAATALPNCKILNLGQIFNRDIVDNQFNSVVFFALSNDFNSNIAATALSNCKVFAIPCNSNITNETIPKTFMKLVEVIIISSNPRINESKNNEDEIISKIIDKFISEQDNLDSKKPFLEPGIFPNLKVLIIEVKLSNDTSDTIKLMQYLSTQLISKPQIYFKNLSSKYVLFEKIKDKLTEGEPTAHKLIISNQTEEIHTYVEYLINAYSVILPPR